MFAPMQHVLEQKARQTDATNIRNINNSSAFNTIKTLKSVHVLSHELYMFNQRDIYLGQFFIIEIKVKLFEKIKRNKTNY